MHLSFLKKKDPFYYSIKELLNFKPKSIKFYKRAFTHRSLNKKDLNGLAVNYERLEFLRVLRNFGTEPIDDPGKLIINKSLKSLRDSENAEASGS